MFRHNGEDMMRVFVAIDAKYEDPSQAVTDVFIAGDPMPLPEADRQKFVAENSDMLTKLCAEAHYQWAEVQFLAHPLPRPTIH